VHTLFLLVGMRWISYIAHVFILTCQKTYCDLYNYTEYVMYIYEHNLYCNIDLILEIDSSFFENYHCFTDSIDFEFSIAYDF